MSEETNHPEEKQTKRRAKKFPPLLFLAGGLVLGVLILAALHFVQDKATPVHYHANFALYVNGQRDEFKSPADYEEVQTCGKDLNDPKGRVHMHDEDPYTVHVHDNAVTWGEMFANVNYALGDSVVKTTKGVYVDGQNSKHLTYILNGKQVFDVANRVIGDKDVLLISYGDEKYSQDKTWFDAIPRTAEKHDKTADPSTCSGSEAKSVTERIKAALGIDKTNVTE